MNFFFIVVAVHLFINETKKNKFTESTCIALLVAIIIRVTLNNWLEPASEHEVIDEIMINN